MKFSDVRPVNEEGFVSECTCQNLMEQEGTSKKPDGTSKISMSSESKG